MEKGPDFERYLALIGAEKEKFSRFRELLLTYNEKFNLTSVTDERDILYKHFLDSLAGEGVFPENSTVAEIGSGAGFPSVPLRIVRKDLSFTLIESTGKKCAFLREVCRELQFDNVTVCNLRAEEGARGELREKFGVCCARAVAKLNTLAEYCLPYVRQGGLFVAYKGSSDELDEGENAIRLLGGKVERVWRYDLPEGYGQRTLVLVRKVRPTPLKYPRGNGRERRDPL